MNCGCDEFGYCYDHNPSILKDRQALGDQGEVAPATTEKTVSNAVEHPAHYNAHPSGIECVTIAEHFNFNVGNAVKYLWRAGLKSASPIEDLKKAAWYIAREIERLEKST